MPTHDPSSACNWPLWAPISSFPIGTRKQPGLAGALNMLMLSMVSMSHRINHRPVEVVGRVESTDRFGFPQDQPGVGRHAVAGLFQDGLLVFLVEVDQHVTQEHQVELLA